MSKAARDLMQPHVISVSPDDPLPNVQRLFFEEEIHGAPVVTDTGRVVGVISSADLLRAAAEERGTPRASSAFAEELVEASSVSGTWWDDEEKLSGQVVSDVMSPDLVAVDVDAPVSEVARCLRESRVHRVLVLEKGRLCGIISTLDLIALLEKEDGS